MTYYLTEPLFWVSLLALLFAAVLLSCLAISGWRRFIDWRRLTKELEFERVRGYSLNILNRSKPDWMEDSQ